MTICSTTSWELTEPLAATTAEARTWLLLEQPGPWGASALTGSHLDPALGSELQARAEGTGTRLALIRRPGRHPDRGRAPGYRVIVAHTVPGNAWVRQAVLTEPHALLNLDMAALGGGDHGGLGAPHPPEPLALVCTNGKRDRCCALLGRPLANELAAMGGAEVWEITHLGGHRFSPTMLVLPYGYAYGRLSTEDAKEVLEATRQGRMVARGCRGRSAWGRPGQAAELAVRDLIGEELADALVVEPVPDAGEDGHWAVRVRHRDGRAWTATVHQRLLAPARSESCGAVPGTPTRMEVTAVAGPRGRRTGTGWLDRSRAGESTDLHLGVPAGVRPLPGQDRAQPA